MAFRYEGETAAKCGVVIIDNSENTSRALARRVTTGFWCHNREEKKRCDTTGGYGKNRPHDPPPHSLLPYPNALAIGEGVYDLFTWLHQYTSLSS